MHPFARQLFGWQADNPERRAAALVLEVKGDFCHDIRRMLTELGRAQDYIELSLDGRLTWNPLSATWLDAYSLAYTVASLLNQLFGKGKEPFWQQAYTNLVRWIIELYRVLPGGWVTLRDVYHCAIDKALFARKIQQAQTYAADMSDTRITIAATALTGDHLTPLRRLGFQPNPADLTRFQTRADPAVFEYLKTHTITHDRERFESTTAQEIRLRVEAVHRWYVHDWNTLDNKIRSSIVEGVSVFLSMFDLPAVARVFCPAAPEARRFHDPAGDAPGTDPTPLAATAMKGVDLPPLDALIERGKVLALNMPAGTNPALARAVGVMLKNAWLQALLRRPAAMQAEPGRYVRPAVFICDEYQAFASVGEDDPSGDEKAFALTRQCRVIPIVATQSISSLRSVLGSSEAWRTLLQTLRTRIFLSLSDEASAEIASKLCGQVRKLKATYAINETSPAERHQFSVRPGRRRARERRGEQEFQRAPRGGVPAARLRAPRQLSGDLSPLRRRAVPAAPARVPQAPLSAGGSPVLARETDRPAMTGDGLDLLKPFLPGLEAALDDPDVSEIMINGPGNVWLEGHGRLRRIDAPAAGRGGAGAGGHPYRPAPRPGPGRPRWSSMRASATARAWRSASRRPARTWRSPCGGSAHDPSRRRNWSHKARCPNTSARRRKRRCTPGATFS